MIPSGRGQVTRPRRAPIRTRRANPKSQRLSRNRNQREAFAPPQRLFRSEPRLADGGCSAHSDEHVCPDVVQRMQYPECCFFMRGA